MLQRQREGTGRGGAIVVVAAALMSIGIVMVATASVSSDRPLFSAAMWHTTFGRQLIFVLAGGAVMFATARLARSLLTSPAWRHRIALVLFVLVLAALIAAFVPGLADPHRGSHRWLSFVGFGFSAGFQPSEFAKPALVLVLASMLTRVDPRSFRRGLVPAVLATAMCVALVGSEDFGTCALLAGVAGAILLTAGCRLRYLLGIGAAGVVGLVGLIFAEPYRLDRITAFRNVWQDAQGDGYQPFQSLATIASGGWFGCGLGAGIQKYGYLPEDHTDFIFAIICEETGAVGAFLVIGLYVALVVVGMDAMRRGRTPFARMLALGLTVWIGLQAFLNMAVVTVMIPTTGISLPLISAGGSGLLATCVGLGLLCAVARDGDARRSLADESESTEREALPARFVLVGGADR